MCSSDLVTERAKVILKLVESREKANIEQSDIEEAQQSEVERILRDVDVNNLSPMQAFMLVGDLVEKVKQ